MNNINCFSLCVLFVFGKMLFYYIVPLQCTWILLSHLKNTRNSLKFALSKNTKFTLILHFTKCRFIAIQKRSYSLWILVCFRRTWKKSSKIFGFWSRFWRNLPHAHLAYYARRFISLCTWVFTSTEKKNGYSFFPTTYTTLQ